MCKEKTSVDCSICQKGRAVYFLGLYDLPEKISRICYECMNEKLEEGLSRHFQSLNHKLE